MSTRKRKQDEEEELVSLPSEGEDESEEEYDSAADSEVYESDEEDENGEDNEVAKRVVAAIEKATRTKRQKTGKEKVPAADGEDEGSEVDEEEVEELDGEDSEEEADAEPPPGTKADKKVSRATKPGEPVPVVEDEDVNEDEDE